MVVPASRHLLCMIFDLISFPEIGTEQQQYRKQLQTSEKHQKGEQPFGCIRQFTPREGQGHTCRVPVPCFPILDMTVPIDSRNPTPKPIMTRMLIMAMIAYKNVNASTVDWIEGEITCLFTRTGNTALGCRICLNSFWQL